MLLSSDAAGARVSLVPEGALLLAGDHIEIDVSVGAGVRLELVEPGGTVAYAMDSSLAEEDQAHWDVTIEVAPGGALVWAGEPFVVAEGARVARTTQVTLAEGGYVALRETLVLGRHGEGPGRLVQDFAAFDGNGPPLLMESLEIGPDVNPLLLGGARVLGSVLTLGRRLPECGEGTHLDCEAEATLVRALSSAAHSAIPSAAWAEAQRLAKKPAKIGHPPSDPDRSPLVTTI